MSWMGINWVMALLIALIMIFFPSFMNRLGYHWTKGSLKAIDECSKIQIKRFKATIVKTNKQSKFPYEQQDEQQTKTKEA